MTSKHLLVLAALAAASATGSAQTYQPSYVDWGIRGSQFPEALDNWQRGTKWCEDDNFFISRVKPKQRFRNQATQVNPNLDETNDKKLIFWVPINNSTGNSLPDGKFDSEVFPFWQYVTHYGNWSCSLGRLPGNFADVAHKNGVPVSTVAGIPYGYIIPEWQQALATFAQVDVDKFADYLEYYGQDGFGYNSEFQGPATLVQGLNDLHGNLVKKFVQTGRNPLFEIIWYDGTKNDGTIMFDRGLISSNLPIWGTGDDVRTSLFFNYNWNTGTILPTSVNRAKMEGRSALDLYAGINMQGAEPSRNKDKIWTYLKDFPVSIGLWGAHSENMFYEGRGEHGTEQSVAQRSYMLRNEKWFTGGTRNPLTSPEINNSLRITADNDTFCGMSSMMTARSSLKWDLSEEPFISYFNLGNGRFFNWGGERANNNPWYNIGIQDYLPTWRWWFANSLLGRTEADRPAPGSMDAEFVWDEAWMGGSLVRIFGTAANSYLHLFKTEFGLKRGDVITVRYKVLAGTSDIHLSLGMKGSEQTAANEDRLVVAEKDGIVAGQWIEKKFTIDEDMAALADKDLAVVALHFANADNLDMRLGEFSIVRPGATSTRPETPVIEKAEILAASKAGADAKLIFHMPNDKPADKVCYNSDVNTSMFRLWFKQADRDPVLMGATTSWAALFYSLPVDVSRDLKSIQVGVSALSMDMTAESDIAWSQPLDITDIYKLSDEIKITHTSVQPTEPFILLYADNLHEPGTWEILDANDNVVLKAENTTVLSANSGIKTPGTYSLRLTGYVEGENGREVKTREFRPLLQVVDAEFGSKPRLYGMYSGDKEYAQVDPGEAVPVEYIGSKSEGSVSRGVKVSDIGFGFRFAETSIFDRDPFAVSMWYKPEGFEDNSIHMFNIRNKADTWPNNAWGHTWQVAGEDGCFGTLSVRDVNNKTYAYTFGDTYLNPGIWYHIIYSYRFTEEGKLYPEVFLNGKLLKPTSWSIDGNVQTGDVEPIDRPKLLMEESVAIGGYLHKTGTVRCVLDNLAVWSKDNFGEADAAIAMGEIDTENLPEGLVGFFDFEDEPNADGTFANKGKDKFTAFSQIYFSTEMEGQGTQGVGKSEIAPGSPYANGRNFNVSTNVEWTAVGGNIADIKGDSKGGSASVTFSTPGRYDVKVKLSNAYGEDTRTLPVYVGNVNIDETFAPAANEVNLVNNPFGETLELAFGAAGHYTLRLFDMSGSLAFAADYDAVGGEHGVFRPEVGSGIYLLRVEGPDGYAATFKAVR